MSKELDEFEQNMQREINAFLNPKKEAEQKTRTPAPKRITKPHSARQAATSHKTGYVVKLAVRTKRLELDTVFEHRSSSISKLEAQLEAEKAARQAGFPIIGHVIEVQRL